VVGESETIKREHQHGRQPLHRRLKVRHTACGTASHVGICWGHFCEWPESSAEAAPSRPTRLCWSRWATAVAWTSSCPCRASLVAVEGFSPDQDWLG
jgi:hypothetical protein